MFQSWKEEGRGVRREREREREGGDEEFISQGSSERERGRKGDWRGVLGFFRGTELRDENTHYPDFLI
jgi:hypothetical protein